ncbi:hypothetical protein Tco_1055376 [Tanacetum coccineum]|uniref:Uncharacterized protein n=1 Tax=Tanacetum coccineum TaxID=301880 RepID=A0ABQ5H0E8_9ASTR
MSILVSVCGAMINYGEVGLVEIFKEYEVRDVRKEKEEKIEEDEEIVEVEELGVEYFDKFPTKEELAYHKYLLHEPITSFYRRMRLGFVVVCAKVTPRQKRDRVKSRHIRSEMGIRVLKGGRRLGIRWWEWRRSDEERRGGGGVIVENKRVGDIF